MGGMGEIAEYDYPSTVTDWTMSDYVGIEVNDKGNGNTYLSIYLSISRKTNRGKT